MSPSIVPASSDTSNILLSTISGPVLQLVLRQARDGDASDCIDGCLTKWMIIFGVILVVEGLLFSHLIYALKGIRKLPRFSHLADSSINSLLRYGNSFSAGIFLSTGIIHLFPEVVELFGSSHSDEAEAQRSSSDEDGEGTSFPWAYFTITASFYFMFGLEKIFIPRLLTRTSRDETRLIDPEIVNSGCTDENEPFVDKAAESTQPENGLASVTFTKGIVYVTALSVHTLFESMAIGLASNFTAMLNIFIALAAHRWATAISITFNLAWTLSYVPFLVLFLVYTVTTPIGIAIGAALTSLDQTVQGVFFAISAATFLYIGAFSAPAQEFVQHPSNAVRKYCAMIGGFGVISLITWALVAGDVHE